MRFFVSKRLLVRRSLGLLLLLVPLLAAPAFVSSLWASPQEREGGRARARPYRIELGRIDPDAPTVGLFEAIEAGQIEPRVIARNAHEATLRVRNISGEVLNIELPEAVVGVQVEPQFGQFGGGGFGQFGGGQFGGGQFGGGQFGGGLGGGQGFGGGFGQFGGGQFGGGQFGGGGFGQFGGGQFGGGGLFAIPPERVASIPIRSVCLDYGRAEPTPRMTYALMPVEDYTDDPTLQELIRMVASNELPENVAQAAAWHLANDMSWQEIAAISDHRIDYGRVPHFSRAELEAALQLVTMAEQRAQERARSEATASQSAASENQPAGESPPPRRASPRSR